MTIREFFDNAVGSKPKNCFIRSHNGVAWQETTYSAAFSRVCAVFAALRKLGLPNRSVDGYASRVAIMRENSAEWMLEYLTVAGAGYIVVPVDPKLRPQEARHILKDSGAVMAIIDDSLLEVVTAADYNGRVICDSELNSVIDGLTSEELSAGREAYQSSIPKTDDIASIVYTSGTTGAPKGAMLSHGNFTSNVEQTFSRVMFYENDNFLLALPLFHVFAFTLNFMVPLRKMSEITVARTMRSIPVDMAETKPTVLMSVPLLSELLYAHAREILCSLRVLGVGGAPISKTTLNGLLKAGVYVLEGYGITECSPGVSYPDEKRYVAGTVGMPLDGMEWRITGSDDTGAGELRVKGPNVMKGYWNNPVETAKAFDEEGFYRTGDIVRPVLNGNFTICGRTKALIVNREGKNIYPEEIERAIAKCPVVAEVIVIGYRVGGEVGEHVGAIVVPNVDKVKEKLGACASVEKIIEYVRKTVQALCHDTLTEYKLPRKVDVRFVPLERTPSMKIKRFVYSRALDE